MEGRQRLGAVLVVAGIGLVAIGATGLLNRPAATAAQPTASLAGAASPAPPVAPVAATPAPTIAITPAPTIFPTVAPSRDAFAIISAFFERLQAAVRAGTQAELADSLGPDTIARYGREQCATALASKPPVPEQTFEILGVRPPAPWVYETDGFVTPMENITTVDARVTGPGANGVVRTETRELHVLVIGSTVFWFTDCGDPIPVTTP